MGTGAAESDIVVTLALASRRLQEDRSLAAKNKITASYTIKVASGKGSNAVTAITSEKNFATKIKNAAKTAGLTVTVTVDNIAAKKETTKTPDAASSAPLAKM